MPAVDRRRWTTREVRDLIDQSPLATPRYELVDGELLVTPSPGYRHQRVVKELILALESHLRGRGLGEVLASPFNVELETESVLQPDVFVLPVAEAIRLKAADSMPARELLLAIEVLSPGSARHDRLTKRRFYQKHTPEYWIADPDARIIERWIKGEERPEIETEQIRWEPRTATENAAELTIDLVELFRRALDD